VAVLAAAGFTVAVAVFFAGVALAAAGFAVAVAVVAVFGAAGFRVVVLAAVVIFAAVVFAAVVLAAADFAGAVMAAVVLGLAVRVAVPDVRAAFEVVSTAAGADARRDRVPPVEARADPARVRGAGPSFRRRSWSCEDIHLTSVGGQDTSRRGRTRNSPHGRQAGAM
jgi:hypothetical protein